MHQSIFTLNYDKQPTHPQGVPIGLILITHKATPCLWLLTGLETPTCILPAS